MSLRPIWRNGAQVPVKIVGNAPESKFSKDVTMARMVRIEDLTGSAAGGDEVAAFELGMCYASGSGGVSRAHFAVVSAEVYRLDWLELSPTGNRRAMFDDEGERWVQP